MIADQGKAGLGAKTSIPAAGVPLRNCDFSETAISPKQRFLRNSDFSETVISPSSVHEGEGGRGWNVGQHEMRLRSSVHEGRGGGGGMKCGNGVACMSYELYMCKNKSCT